MLLRCFYVVRIKFKKGGQKSESAFSVICVSVIALGVIVYVSTKPAKDVNEPTTVQETTQVQRSVTVEDTTVPTTAAETTAQPKTEPESTSMLQSENNTPYKGVYQYPLGETVVQGYSQELTKTKPWAIIAATPRLILKAARAKALLP